MKQSISANLHAQKGVALLIGLILLLVLSVIGLTAIRGTTQQEKMAASHQQQTQTFQAAEAAIRMVMAELREDAGVETPAENGGLQMLVTAIANGENPAPAQIPKRTATFDSKTQLSAEAQIVWTGTALAAGDSLGKFAFYQFSVDSNASQDGTNAVAHNRQGLGFIAPK